MRDFSLATKRCKVFSSYLFVDSQTVGCVFCLPESLFQHFLTVEDIDVAMTRHLHLTSIEATDLLSLLVAVLDWLIPVAVPLLMTRVYSEMYISAVFA